MTHVIIALDEAAFIHKNYEKSIDELSREIEMGAFEFPVPMKNPTAVRLQNFLLVTEREENPMLNRNQQVMLELLCQGASEYEMEKALFLSKAGIRHQMDSLKKKFNVRTREELAAVYSRQYRK